MIDTLGCLLIDASDRLAVSPSRGRSEATRRPGTTASATAVADGGDLALATRSLAGKPLVDWVLRRASEAEQLQRVVVILPLGETAEAFKANLPSGITVFESDRPDRLGRLCDCLQAHPARGVVDLRLDCPLLDPCLIDRLVSSLGGDPSVDYATFRSDQAGRADGLRALLGAQLGLFAEYFRAAVLQRLDGELVDRAARDDFSSYVRSHPEYFLLRLVALPRELDRDDLRLALRHQDDWDHAEQIIEALGGEDEDLDWQSIVGLLRGHPALRRRMADLNLREEA